MSVEFACTHCRKRLSIASRKAGATIDCPRCGQPTVVPDEQSAAAAMAMSTSSVDAPLVSEMVVYDDIETIFPDRPGSGGMAGQPPGGGAPAAAQPSQGASSAAERPQSLLAGAAAPDLPRQLPPAGSLSARRPAEPEPLLVLSRRAVYLQAVLFCLVALAAFIVGFAMGRGGDAAGGPHGPDGQQAIALAGHVAYWRTAGQLEPDADALIIALPTGDYPATTIAPDGLRPAEADAGDHEAAYDESVEAVAGLGGAMTRADALGEFLLVVPAAGDYHLLMVSRHARRSTMEPLDARVAREMARYFTAPSQMLWGLEYTWRTRSLASGQAPLAHEFARPAGAL